MSANYVRNHNTDETSAFFANNDASSYNTRYLKSIRNKERFQELHFYNCSVDLIDELFPKQNQKGTLDPPPSYRASAVALGQWRELDHQEQARVIEKEGSKQDGPTKEQVVGGVLGQKHTVSEDGERSSSAPPTKVAKTEGNPSDIPDRWDPVSPGIDLDFLKDRICRGMNLTYLRKNFHGADSKLGSFSLVVGDAMNYKKEVYKNGRNWPFAMDPRIAGAIIEAVPPADVNGNLVQLKWICVQLPNATGGEASANSTKLDSIHFHHASCDRSSTSFLCENCRVCGLDLLNLCDQAQK